MNVVARIIQIIAILAMLLSTVGFFLNAFDAVQLHRYLSMPEQDFLFLCLAQIAIALLLAVTAQMLVKHDSAAKSLLVPVLLAELLLILTW